MRRADGTLSSVWLGGLLVFAGRAAMILAPALEFFLATHEDTRFWIGINAFMAWFFVMFVVLFTMPLVIKAGMRIAKKDARLQIAEDARAPVVYLRPFAEDGLARTDHDLRDDDDFGYVGNLFANGQVRGLRALVKGYLGVEDPTLEEEMAAALAHYGPVVAIGRPGESLRLAGAHRMYVSDEHWQDEVEALLRRAGIVVWQAGTSAGTWWELERIVALVDPRNVVLLIPSPVQRANQYHALWQQADPVLPRGLPRTWDDVNLVTFDADWTPSGHRFEYLPPLLRLFTASGLDVRGSLETFLARRPAQQAGARRNLGWFAAVGVGPLLLPALLWPVALTFDRSRGLASARHDDCRALVEEIDGFLAMTAADAPHPANFAAALEHVDSRLRVADALVCSTRARDAVTAQVRAAAVAHADAMLPAWENQVRESTASADDVDAALHAAAADAALARWRTSRDGLREQALRRAVALEIEVRHLPADIDRIFSGTIEDNARRTLRWQVDEALPGDLRLRDAGFAGTGSREPPRGLRIVATFGYTDYDESSEPIVVEGFAPIVGVYRVPGELVLDVNLRGCDRGDATQAVATETSVELPTDARPDEINALRDAASQALVDAALPVLAQAVASCFVASAGAAPAPGD